jgi:DNA-binding MarR family transcriptional regulator
MFFLFLNPAEITRHLLKQFPYRQRVEEFIDIAREVDSTISVGALATFVHVANRMPELAAGDLSLRDIADDMRVPYTSFARQLDVLAEGAPPPVRGLNLIEKGVHPDNRRQRQVMLTNDGARLLSQLSAVFAAARNESDTAGAVAKVKPTKKTGTNRKKKT